MNRCENCDRPKPTREEAAQYKGGEGEHLCWGGCEEEDWRTRALTAERELERLRRAKHTAECVRQSAYSANCVCGADGALRDMLRDVAERQREACAVWMRGPEDVATKMDNADADYVRATPLVTENP